MIRILNYLFYSEINVEHRRNSGANPSKLIIAHPRKYVFNTVHIQSRRKSKIAMKFFFKFKFELYLFCLTFWSNIVENYFVYYHCQKGLQI